ncbi:hypothetical protein N7539_002738 [Penicillium diatomitis]|uniref:Nuclear pore complex protein n=1 Tax=Penicillium diatomitis TaxID=2819901 RepID=A0A9X0BYZ4_9EURO|nr:uncharacterized protein N7539_002738 [Penicillium diatomitis]KAJ5491171.1 hypothetical protein N7539_002738 [Penicillium diatomitis]
MAPMTRAARSAASGAPSNLTQGRSKEPKVISIDEDDEGDQMMEDEESYEDQSGSQGDEDMKDHLEEDMDDDVFTNGSDIPALNSDLKSSTSLRNRSQESPKLFTESGAGASAQEMLRPLRKTADRVTRQIEAFAEKLDQFKRKKSTDAFQSVQAAYKLVESYRDLTQNAINELDRPQTLKKAKTSLRTSIVDNDTAVNTESRRLQLQAETWRLLLNLISVDEPASRASFREGQREAFQNLHRYSSDREIWEEFLGADQFACECTIAMRWLEETAKAAPQEIDNMIKELEDQAERGQGLWAHGWLFTKEAIKGHKRLRVWPLPLDPNDPATTRALLNNDTQTPLITQLDPDALIRQNHSLQKQDACYEQATWMACWKMLRQGSNWTQIREWAESRLESWRAVSLCGSSVDKGSSNTRTPVDDGITRLMNSRSQDSWRAACLALTKDANTGDYEKAVYALLCGEIEPTAKACQTWDDYLYVYFNRVVLSRYQGFCRQLQRKLSQSPNEPMVFQPEPAGHADLQKYIQFMRGNEALSGEAREPFRHIQAAILSKSYGTFFDQLSQAVSQVGIKKYGSNSYIPSVTTSQSDDAMIIMAEDLDALKMATHLYVIVDSLGYVPENTRFTDTASVVVTGYIAALQEKCMPDLIPSYAALLPGEICNDVLARILIDIIDYEDRHYQLRVIKKHGIDINAVLDAQWSWLDAGVSSIEHSAGLTGYSRVRRLPDGTRVLMPPKKDLIGTSVAIEDEKMIRNLEWLRCVGRQWSKICARGLLLYRKFFVAGKLAAARELGHRVRMADVSHETFNMDVFEFPDLAPSLEEETPLSPIKSKRHHANRRSVSSINGTTNGVHKSAYQQAVHMWNLEAMALGFDALEQFAIVYDQSSKTKRRRDSGSVRDFMAELEALLQEIEDCVGLIVDEWLGKSDEVDEERDFEYIRRTYLPELVLDYHNALYYASHALEKPNLLSQCMTVSIWVANNGHLTRSFTQAQRMSELVDCLALASKAMVLTDPKNDVTFPNGQTLGIWRVSVPEDDDALSLAEQREQTGAN